ncbi:MAG TPA: pyridoxal phosphate-dependent aminotransferase [Candidatus Sulfotelmatobacter sp.]|nr:pyridoxal phosphate-dependent aminotransferase [Candidatus Sulfotelmatobacter sp.]
MTVDRLKHVVGIGVDTTALLADAAQADVLRLENLDTDLRPPEAALAAARQAVDTDDANSYLPFFGADELRQAVAEHVSPMSGIRYDWRSECIITAGGCNGFLNTVLALLNPGDEIIMTDPIYVGLINRVRLAGGVPVFVPLIPESGRWRLDLDVLRHSVTPRTRAVLMMSPSMPSGAVVNRTEWESVAEVCQRANAWLIYNAAMERILFDGAAPLHPASLEGMASRTITVGTVSKEQRMIGWRVGWVIGPAEVMRDISLVTISNVVCQVGIAQRAAAAALRHGNDSLLSAVAEWQARRDCVQSELKSLPLMPCGGGWSVLLDVGQLGWGSEEASRLLLSRGGVAATAMKNWGRDRSDRYVRLVFSNEPVARLQGLRQRVERALTQRA